MYRMPIWDFHSHILPGADHGSSGMGTTEKQLKLVASAGITHIVATPHFYPNCDTAASFLSRRAVAEEKLLSHGIPEGVKIFSGAEVLVCEGLHHMEDLESLAVRGTKVILLEMPFGEWSDSLYRVVRKVRERGLIPVLAHIDRYPPDRVKPFLEEEYFVQLNADAFASLFHRRAYRAHIDSGLVVGLGSDLHGCADNAYRQFHRMQKYLGPRAERVFAHTAELLKDAIPLNPKKD